MPAIIIYTKDYCPYCARAKELLKQKNQMYTEIDIGIHPERRDEMITKSNGRTTVPQLFINDLHVGGCDDLYALEHQGKLNELLQG